MRLLILFLLISSTGFAQLMQEANTSVAMRRTVAKNYLLLPKVCGAPAAPDGLNYWNNDGSIVADTCNRRLLMWYNGGWIVFKDTAVFGGGGSNFANANLTATDNREHNFAGYDLLIKNYAQLNFESNGYGTGDGSKLYSADDEFSFSAISGGALNAGFSGTTGVGALVTAADTIFFRGGAVGPYLKPVTSTAKYKALLLDSTTGSIVTIAPDSLAGGGGGVTTVGTFSGTGNANGASISGSTITMHPATPTEPGAVSIGAQEIAGVKTFNDVIRTDEPTTNTAIPSIYFRDGGAGSRVGIGRRGADGNMQFFTYATGLEGFRFYGGGDFNDAASDWFRISSSRVLSNVTLDMGPSAIIRTAGAQSNTAQASIYFRDFTGAGNQIGIGRGIADVQFFGINDYGFRWYGGGQFNNGAANWLYLDQNGLAVGGGTNPASAILTATSTTKGFLPPRMTQTQRNAVSSPTAGLQVFNTTDNTVDVRDGTRWNNQPNGLKASATLNFGSTAAQSSADLTITVTGAADGDIVIVGPVNGSTNANSCYTAWVSAADTVTVRFNNYSSGAIDPASGTFKVYVIKN